jgi:hypothetical protein
MGGCCAKDGTGEWQDEVKAGGEVAKLRISVHRPDFGEVALGR